MIPLACHLAGHGARRPAPGRRVPDRDPPTGTGSPWTAGWGRECTGAGGAPAGLEGPRRYPEPFAVLIARSERLFIHPGRPAI